MAEIKCIRCNQTREEIEDIPHGGSLGKTLKEKICNVCWEEWYEQSIKIINEYRLSLREQKSREFLATQMKIFLKLAPPPAEGGIQVADSPPSFPQR